jgi:hypothetical protein
LWVTTTAQIVSVSAWVAFSAKRGGL